MGPGTHDRWRGSAAGTSAGAPTTIRLTVPAAPDHLHVLRIAVRVVAGRAGCSDDARSRLQAAVGAGFFEPVDRAAPEGTVLAELTSDEGRMRSEEHTSELQSLMRISYAVFSRNT